MMQVCNRAGSAASAVLRRNHGILATTAPSSVIAAAAADDDTQHSFFSTKSKSRSSSTFKPKKRIPKHLAKAPTPKAKRGAARRGLEPNILQPRSGSGGGGDWNDTEQYGEQASEAMKFLHRTKKQTSSLDKSNLMPNSESFLKVADYMTSEMGSTEDLVFERRAITMGGWTPEEGKKFRKQLDTLLEEEELNIWERNEWEEDEDDNHNVGDVGGRGQQQFQQQQTAHDPNQKAYGPWSETIVTVDRVQKVQRGGTMVRYRALVIGGNLNGCAGFGIAKANTPNEATTNAARMAKRNIFFIDRYNNNGITSDLVGRQNSCKVTLRAVQPNGGLSGHPLIQEIMKYFGISDCSSKSHGNRNVYNVVRATFKAIMTHESLEDIALKRGKRLLNLEKARRLGI